MHCHSLYSVIYYAPSFIILCRPLCSVIYYALSFIILCHLLCSVIHYTLSFIMLCHSLCSVVHYALSFIMLSLLYCLKCFCKKFLHLTFTLGNRWIIVKKEFDTALAKKVSTYVFLLNSKFFTSRAY